MEVAWPYQSIVVRSWRVSRQDEIVHWLVYDLWEFVRTLPQDAGHSANWTVGLSSDGKDAYLPFPGTEPRIARFEMYASREATGLKAPAPWSEVSQILQQQRAFGPFGFEAYDANLPTLMGVPR